MDDEFDDILLDDYNIDLPDRKQPNVSSLDDDNDETQATTTSKKPTKRSLMQTYCLNLMEYILKNEVQHIKFKKTRGHEHEDLKRLMDYYTIWANNLYPGLLFRDFARRVVNPAKSKPVRMVMEQWSDEARQRNQVRLDVQNELSGKTVGDDDGSDGGRAAAQDDESSEDDNRPLFFPISSTSQANTLQNKTAKPKPKGKSKAKPAAAKPKSKTFIGTDDEDDEQPLFTSSQQNNKRKIVLDDSSDEEDTHNMSRSSALALIIERKRKRQQAQREEQERAARPKPSTSRSIIEDYDDNEDEPALFGHQDKDEQVELALSDSELAALGIPPIFSAQEDPVEDIELALTEAELLELGLPTNKPNAASEDNVQMALSDNELETLGLATTPSSKTAANHTQQSQQQEEQFSDNELFDIQEA
ncbi:replication fork protection component Swi3-domain-containing protein [Mucor lusitanicus]